MKDKKYFTVVFRHLVIVINIRKRKEKVSLHNGAVKENKRMLMKEITIKVITAVIPIVSLKRKKNYRRVIKH